MRNPNNRKCLVSRTKVQVNSLSILFNRPPDINSKFSLPGSGRGQPNIPSTGSSSLIAQLSARLTPSKQQQLHNERYNEAKQYAKTLATNDPSGIYEVTGRTTAPRPGPESIYGKKSDFYAPPPRPPLTSSQLPPPPLAPSNNQKQLNQIPQQRPVVGQTEPSSNRIYHAPQPPQPLQPRESSIRYQTPPQAIPAPSGSPSPHYSINQKIYMSPTNPFLGGATSPPSSHGIYGTTGENQSPRQAPPPVPSRSYLQQYHQGQLGNPQTVTTSGSGSYIVPPQQSLYQRPQPPGTTFVVSPLYSSSTAPPNKIAGPPKSPSSTNAGSMLAQHQSKYACRLVA